MSTTTDIAAPIVGAAAPDPQALLGRKQLAAALTAKGFPIASATLATCAVRGGGPPFRKFGRATLYRWDEAMAWAENRLSGPMQSTAEARVRRLSTGHAA